jgi:hypothetical protein
MPLSPAPPPFSLMNSPRRFDGFQRFVNSAEAMIYFRRGSNTIRRDMKRAPPAIFQFDLLLA